MKSKYIVLVHGTLELPVVFSELIEHASTAQALGGKVIGAGFCFIDQDRYHCYGESISCRAKSRGDVDAKVLNKMLGVEQ